ncbi:sensor histidine kinase [Halobacteriaceae archaeon GCM10025711]
MGLGALTQFQLLDAIPVLDRTAQNFVIEAMDDGVVVVDADDRIVNLNPQAERLLGNEGFDVGDTLPETYTDRGTTADGEGEDRNAVTPFAVDGAERYFEVDVSDLRDYHDRVTGRVVVFHDVTERLTREQRLSVLSRVLRHNLRNEMNVVYGYADGLSVESPADEAAVDLIKRKALTLVEQGSKAREIQEFLENGNPGGDPVDIGAAVRSVVARTRDAYPDVAFELDLPDEETACPAVVESVVENLVTNAAKHNTDPDPVVSVTARRDGADVVVAVVDNGPGIPREERAVLESGRETSLEHGSGLGLWFVTWAVDHADGSVSFEEADPGSAVTVRLPRRPTG